MALKIELPPEVEARYAAEARDRGLPLERYVADRLIQEAPTGQPANGKQPLRPLNLPAKKGTVLGSLHRRDIYADLG